MKNGFLAAALFLLAVGPLTGAEDENFETLRAELQRLVPERQPDSIRPTPVPGLYEVAYDAQVFYFTRDGRYMLRGELMDLKDGVNLTQRAGNATRAEALTRLDGNQAIVFGPDNPRHSVTVFTDIDCPYCRRMHEHIEDYKRHGIEIRYLLFPRTGIDSPSYDTAVSVWCAEDAGSALTRAKQGRDVEKRRCENPVAEHFQLGQKIGVSGTPAFVLEDGEILTGYRPPDDLAELLEERDL